MPEDKSQAEKFKEAARELECDDNEDHFKDRLKRLVRDGSQKNTAGDDGDKV